jgi:hypothetical protein
MKRKNTDTFQPSGDVRRVQSLGGGTFVRIGDHRGKWHQLAVRRDHDDIFDLLLEVGQADDQLAARDAADIGAYWNTGLVDLAADRICELEAEVLALRTAADRLRSAVRGHRGRRDFMGGMEQCDRDLWTEVLGDGAWGAGIKGDG